MDAFSSPLSRKVWPGVRFSALLVAALMLLSLGLHLVNLNAIGNANEYYTAAVQSMLQSGYNFFFVAAEPGGSVTVDKPPLGLWIEAAFAWAFGVSGVVVSLPNILAGVLSVPLLYALVKRYAGRAAGLIAALVMSLTPIFLATNRNNTMDGMLVFTLLLAAWAFVRAAEGGGLRTLLLGAFLLGLGFNIKMWQAFLPLPAFYALYFFGARRPWGRKILELGAASLLLALVSLSWALAVDFTPPEARPYIGSSGDNTVLGLMFGHNGLSRLENPRAADEAAPPSAPPQALDACRGLSAGAACEVALPNGERLQGVCEAPPGGTALACLPSKGRQPQGNGNPPQGGPAPGGAPSTGGVPFGQETGAPGVFRFFTAPLSRQASWLLPFALLGGLLLLFGGALRLPLESPWRKAFLLWGGWLWTCVVFLSAVSGIFHAYYTIMLAPPLGALVGMVFARLYRRGAPRADAALALLSALTLAFQAFAVRQYGVSGAGMLLPWALLGMGLTLRRKRARMYALTLAALLLVPAYWSVKTVTGTPDSHLPTAYLGEVETDSLRKAPAPQNLASLLVDFLQSHTRGVRYLAAVPSSQQGAALVLATGRPVLYMGGFSGQDAVVSAADLQAMVARGELRYVLYGGERGNKGEIAAWLEASCRVVEGVSVGQGGPDRGMQLYECGR